MFTQILLPKKAFCVLEFISEAFECKDPDVIVTTLVHPIIEYYNVLWGPTYTLDYQKLERIQHKLLE